MTERAYTNDEIAELEGLRASIKAIDDAPVERYRAALAVLRGDPAQGVNPSAEQYERMRRTLESRSVRLMGPRSPFWQCEYCQALSQSPIAFKHKPECLMATPEERKNGDPCPSCKMPYSDGDTCPAGRGGCPMGGDF